MKIILNFVPYLVKSIKPDIFGLVPDIDRPALVFFNYLAWGINPPVAFIICGIFWFSEVCME